KSDFAQFMDEFMSPLLVTSDDNDYTEELLDGSFDWEEFNYLPEKIKEMQDEGLLNEDVLTAQDHEKEELMAQDKVGFVISTLPAESVRELNSDINLGIIPVPSIHDGDEPSWIGGERHTVAISNESDHKDEAKNFIEFISEQDIVKEMNCVINLGLIPVPSRHDGDEPSWMGGDRHTVAISNESDHKDEAKKFIEFLSQPEIVKETAEGTDLPTGLTNEEADIYYSD